MTLQDQSNQQNTDSSIVRGWGKEGNEAAVRRVRIPAKAVVSLELMEDTLLFTREGRMLPVGGSTTRFFQANVSWIWGTPDLFILLTIIGPKR